MPYKKPKARLIGQIELLDEEIDSGTINALLRELREQKARESRIAAFVEKCKSIPPPSPPKS